MIPKFELSVNTFLISVIFLLILIDILPLYISHKIWLCAGQWDYENHPVKGDVISPGGVSSALP